MHKYVSSVQYSSGLRSETGDKKSNVTRIILMVQSSKLRRSKGLEKAVDRHQNHIDANIITSSNVGYVLIGRQRGEGVKMNEDVSSTRGGRGADFMLTNISI